MVSKTEKLRQSMSGAGKAQTFVPRQSVVVQPIVPEVTPQPAAKPKASTPAAPKKQQAIKQSPSKQVKPDADKAHLASLYVKIPKEDKRWLDHQKVDQDKELSELIVDAIQLLKKQF
jgi:hypothetical protein